MTTTDDSTATEAAVPRTDVAPSRRNLRPPWKPGQSGNPRGRAPYRRRFEEALAKEIDGAAEALAAKLVTLALDGDLRALAILVDRLVPKLDRHEIEAEDAREQLCRVEGAREQLARRLARLEAVAAREREES